MKEVLVYSDIVCTFSHFKIVIIGYNKKTHYADT